MNATETATVDEAQRHLEEVAEAVLDGTATATDLVAAERALEDAKLIAERAAEIAKQRAEATREAAAQASAERLAATIAELAGDPRTDELARATQAAVDALVTLWRVAEQRASTAAGIYTAAESLAAGRFDVPVRAGLVAGGGRVVWTPRGALSLIPAESVVLDAVAQVVPADRLDPEANAILAMHRDRVQRVQAEAARRPALTNDAEAKRVQRLRQQQERRRIAGREQSLRASYLGQLRAIATADERRDAGEQVAGDSPTLEAWLDRHPAALEVLGVTRSELLAADLRALVDAAAKG